MMITESDHPSSAGPGVPPQNPTPLVSVVMPNLDKGSYISEAIASVLAQEYPNLELLVVDNGSTDQSVPIIAEYAKADKRVRFLKQQIRGVSFAMNTGIRSAEGELVTFLGSDDVCHPKRLSEQVSVMQKNVGSVCYTEGFIIDAAGSPTGQLYNRDLTSLPAKFEGRLFHELVKRNFVIGGSLMARKADLDPDPFDGSLGFGEDWDLLLRLSRSHDFRYVPLPLYGYRVYRGNTWAKGKERMFHENLVRTYEKWLRTFPLTKGERNSVFKRLLKSQEELYGRAGVFRVVLHHPSSSLVVLGIAGSTDPRKDEDNHHPRPS